MTIDAAQEVLEREVIEPALEHPEGIARVLAFSEAYLSYLERHVFPGGCFFASVAAEVDSREGRVTDRLRELMSGGVQWLAGLLREAQARGEVDPARTPTSSRSKSTRCCTAPTPASPLPQRRAARTRAARHPRCGSDSRSI